MKRSRVLAAAAAVAVIASVTAALSNGLWLTLPIVGQGSFCATTVSGTGAQTGITGQGQGTLGSLCGQVVPAGEIGLTGLETIPLDIFGVNPTVSQAGAPTQTQRVPVGLIAPGAIYQGSFSAYKQMLRNGDISVNPFQSGASQAANISNTITTSADGFRMLGGASSAIQWSSQTGATDIVANQFTKSLRFQRASGNANTVAVCEINVVTSQDAVALQGQSFVYSFWAKAGGNFSPTLGNVAVTVASGTGTDQSAANFNAGTWTGQVNDITAANSSNSLFPTSVTAGVATVQTLPTGQVATWVQYWVSGTIPTTATQVGTQICFTPVGTAGANDWVETSNHQLELVGAGVLTPSAFEHHTAQQDLTLAQRFLWTINDSIAATQRLGLCQATTANIGICVLALPVTMRAAPTATVTTATSFGITVAAGTAGTCTTLASVATGNTTTAASLSCTTGSTLAAGNAAQFIGAATSAANLVTFSSEL